MKASCARSRHGVRRKNPYNPTQWNAEDLMTDKQRDESGSNVPMKSENVKDIARSSAKKARAISLSGGLALIFSLTALVLSGYLWYMLSGRQDLLSTDVTGQLAQLDRGVDALQEGQAMQEQRVNTLQETQDTLKSGFNKLAADVGRARREWVLAETEHLLLIANHRLQLGRDVDLALAALRAADRQLKDLAQPNLLPVRRTLAREIGALEAVDNTDTTGLALRLGDLADKVDRLPLITQTQFKKTVANGEPATAAAPRRWDDFLREMWRDLRSLIRIRDDVDVRRPLLPPEQHYFLRENLRLMLLGAQLALLERDEATYQQNLRAALTWLKDYFDNDTQVVANAKQELEKMLAARVNVDLPDISASLAELKKVATRQEAP